MFWSVSRPIPFSKHNLRKHLCSHFEQFTVKFPKQPAYKYTRFCKKIENLAYKRIEKLSLLNYGGKIPLSLGVPDLLRNSEAKLLLWLGCIKKLLWFVVGGYWKWSFTFASMNTQSNYRSRFAFPFNPYDQYEPFCNFETYSLFKPYSPETSLFTSCALRCLHWTIHCKLRQASRLQIHYILQKNRNFGL